MSYEMHRLRIVTWDVVDAYRMLALRNCLEANAHADDLLAVPTRRCSRLSTIL